VLGGCALRVCVLGGCALRGGALRVTPFRAHHTTTIV
jgi:hypothetical protein